MTGGAVPDDLLEHASNALTRFFERRCGGDRVDDLVQETLKRVTARKDYSFETGTDFLKVCYGFARIILKEESRRWKRQKSEVEYEDQQQYAGSVSKSFTNVEKELYYRQLLELVKPCLKDNEWQMLLDSFEIDRETQAQVLGVSSANAMGVRIFRALAKVRERFRKFGQTSL